MTVPARCHHAPDTDTSRAITGEHRDPCTHADNPGRCRGCAPCTAPHCTLCGWRHLDNAHPHTCPKCIGTTRDDLTDIRHLDRAIRLHAIHGGNNGRLLAAAPIPGGDALVTYVRTGPDGPDLLWSPHLNDDHLPGDPVPVLLPLLAWVEQVAAWLGHTAPARPTVGGACHYLAEHLTQLAQTNDGPDWPRMADDLAAIRRQLEQIVHDERHHEFGVPCDECGEDLVRRFGDPRPCEHDTAARRHLVQLRAAHTAAVQLVRETRAAGRTPTPEQLAAARRVPTDAEISAARHPCNRCTTSRHGQGGIVDPAVGQSWECMRCRKTYTPGEYAHAVRRSLLEGGPAGDGWTHIAMAAEAATTMTGHSFPPRTVRRWAERLQVAVTCRWVAGERWGMLLVHWPSVAERAAETVRKAELAALERARFEREATALRAAIDAGEDGEEAGRRLGIHPARVRRLLEEWEVDAA
ncbi:hypothetical protein [Nocardioides massiliensis]|uniref:Helix-turn-helix domain-containing protein n=1 Tax=Nocardioides massiliensis TaxID=1325935 RepID=A0ABT9NJ08_9ACTN|nr:hypothetical protein [Nocardioides massiliensis]MDP9820398.1 hypothetical protein [Nocardioides massiliensis]